jgi:hypothetical protein
LRQTWLLLPERHLKKLQKLEQVMQPQQNFWTYREWFDKVQGPKIPYLAVSLRDITFINIGNNNYREDGSINFDRLSMLHQQVQNIRRLQVGLVLLALSTHFIALLTLRLHRKLRSIPR